MRDASSVRDSCSVRDGCWVGEGEGHGLDLAGLYSLVWIGEDVGIENGVGLLFWWVSLYIFKYFRRYLHWFLNDIILLSMFNTTTFKLFDF